MTAPVLALDNVSAGYGRTTIVRDINLAIEPGSVVALLGANGAGKTTILRCAAGLLRPSIGRVHMDGKDVSGIPPNGRARAGLCMIPEGRGIFRTLTVAENLRLQVPPWMSSSSFESVLSIFPVLHQRLQQRAGTLSGGEQQMLALARCYLTKPSIILLDEVSTGLAPLVLDVIFAAIGELKRSGVSLLIVEQYVDRVLALADTACILSHGSLTFTGPASALNEEAVLSEYLGRV